MYCNVYFTYRQECSWNINVCQVENRKISVKIKTTCTCIIAVFIFHIPIQFVKLHSCKNIL